MNFIPVYQRYKLRAGQTFHLVHSVAQASFEVWTKYYRPDANTPNMTVSYYTKGALVGLCLDLTLRRKGKTTLDAVLRTLYQRCYAATTQIGRAHV